MFAKIFGQIFDSSLAEDYNCRRMFMDLLVLADSDGIVDMTPEAIARRTNAPLEEVHRYVDQLSQPDPLSRCPDCEGRRLVLIDSHRSWGWRIVNFIHYRNLRNEEARREYFRDAQRKHRASVKAVKDKSKTPFDSNGQSLTSASVSASSSPSDSTKLEGDILSNKKRGKPENQKEVEDFCGSIGLPRSDGEAMWLHWNEKGFGKVKDWRLTVRKWQSFGYLPSQKQSKNSQYKKPERPSRQDEAERWYAKKYGQAD